MGVVSNPSSGDPNDVAPSVAAHFAIRIAVTVVIDPNTQGGLDDLAATAVPRNTLQAFVNGEIDPAAPNSDQAERHLGG